MEGSLGWFTLDRNKTWIEIKPAILDISRVLPKPHFAWTCCEHPCLPLLIEPVTKHSCTVQEIEVVPIICSNLVHYPGLHLYFFFLRRQTDFQTKYWAVASHHFYYLRLHVGPVWMFVDEGNARSYWFAL